MKRPFTLFILLFAGPSLASAQFTATSGGTSVGVFGTSSSFGAAGPDFSMSGLISYGRSPLDTGSGWGEGSTLELVLYGDTLTPNLDISVNVHGAPLTVFTAFATFSSEPISVPGPGTHMYPFIFSSAVSSLEGDLNFFGRAIVTLDVVPRDTPGVVDILSANYTFTNPSHVPDPSTTSLLLLGVAGLSVLGFRRKSRVTLFAAG